MNRKRTILKFTIFLLVTFLLGLGVISVIFVSYTITKSKNLSMNKGESEYDVLTVNSYGDVVSMNHASTNFDLKGATDFFSFDDIEGNHVLISRMDSKKFTCSGSCYCDESEFRRGATHTLGRSLIYLVASTSSLVAMKYAKDHYDRECVKTMSDSCQKDSILSVVDDCQQTFMNSEKIEEEVSTDADQEDLKDALVKPFDEKTHKLYSFLCRGNCLTRNWKKEYENLAKYKGEELTEKEERAHEFISTEMGKLGVAEKCEEKVQDRTFDYRIEREEAPESTETVKTIVLGRFIQELDTYCQGISSKKLSTLMKGVEGSLSVCAGRTTELINPTAVCVELRREW